ncbi:hypothetical protein HPC49_32290 [Pyxidicoccus fallax]|uniref:Uncharacterized protein n=2 Tax=Pyxidicoccus fallax TaxID=394095 RepID=A0A848LF29_9BACT|nr:hypothetical protein [Pyxidicoccus fallax]NPC82890.1 hypothetical protein [Pyxidicoccus fallax]
MVGLCALTSGCRERGEGEARVEPRAEAPANPGFVPAGPVAAVPAQPPVAQNTAAPAGAPEQRAPATSTPVREPVQGGTAAAPAGTGTTAAAPAGTGATAAAPARGGRVMIGYEAVQARDDEAWHLGAARAAQEAATGGSGKAGSSLDEVVIASSTVSGRVTRVGKNAITVRDREGGVYELQLDARSRGLRQGRKVSLRRIEEGTPVRARFDLVGGRTVARDVQIRR